MEDSSKRSPVQIAGVVVNNDSEGRYNLNALHKASGLGEEKAPAKWLRNKASLALTVELEKETGQICLVSEEGRNGGTFAHELLAVSYAGWISPSFQLKVNQAFLDVKSGRYASPSFTIPQTFAEALRLAAEQSEKIEKQTAIITEMKPKADFHDGVASAINSQDFQAVAKVFGTGRNRFMGWLRDRSFLQANNRPYQRYEDAGYFRVIERKRKDPQTGEDITYTKTLVTGKGLTYLHKKWQEDHPSSEGESA